MKPHPHNSTLKIQFKLGLLTIQKSNKIQSRLNKTTNYPRVLNEYVCCITDKNYNNPIIQQAFQKAKQAEFQSLNFSRNDQENILKNISHISFISLKMLELSENNIQSIQPLTWLNSPNLRVLDLSINLITSIKPLSKSHCHSISQLKLGNNLIKQLQPLTRMKFRSNQNQRDLCLKDVYNHGKYKYMNANITIIAKLEDNKRIKQEWIYLGSKGRIKTQKVYEALKRKSSSKKQRTLLF